MHAFISRAMRTPWTLVELFAIANLGSLAVDVYIAHSTNLFERWQEWIPVGFSAAAPLLLIVAIWLGGLFPEEDAYPVRSANWRDRTARGLGLFVGWVSVAVGIAGMVYHLQSHFFEQQTVRNLVYTAPFAAPLAYAGIGLLLILNRMVVDRTIEWAQWVVFLTLGGFVGNLVLSLADHAQNGFFNKEEWIPVAAAGAGIGFLLMLVVRPADVVLRRTAAWIMVAQIIVGVAGFGLHLRSNFYRPAPTAWERFVYGAPIFAPLLFANLAILALLGIWAIGLTIEEEPEVEPDRAGAV